MAEENKGFEQGWAVLQVIGYRQVAGYVSPAVIVGAAVLRVDVPMVNGKGTLVTQYFTPAAIYSLTPITREVAVEMTRLGLQTVPVKWGEPVAKAAASTVAVGLGDLPEEDIRNR